MTQEQNSKPAPCRATCNDHANDLSILETLYHILNYSRSSVLCMSTPYRLASEGQYPPNNSLLLSFSTIYTPLRIFQMVKSDYACMECICSRPFAQLFDWIRPNSSVRPLIVQNTEAGGSQLRLLTSHHSRTKLDAHFVLSSRLSPSVLKPYDDSQQTPYKRKLLDTETKLHCLSLACALTF
ncbi:hypothetical protein CY34DRAFT_180675 [Suillus luteus UH-Slu-Lm8-n1]|uniref:Uncharacterized protein n=1 Tax=Suillus luteus UH-Slu-Lm8-n1 TaxID=930992 RepID=A0A0D0AVE9_9AGAM|nr:hypothetical protein CY34DRAFT_180675 [Suillus luteus UH-Slu-Lm8-n1]